RTPPPNTRSRSRCSQSVWVAVATAALRRPCVFRFLGYSVPAHVRGGDGDLGATAVRGLQPCRTTHTLCEQRILDLGPRITGAGASARRPGPCSRPVLQRPTGAAAGWPTSPGQLYSMEG